MLVDITNPLISIIVPVYNTEQYLEKCIKSILNQNFKKYELICVNDGSTDNSICILKKLAEKDERILIINNLKNRGSSYARNCAMKRAQGKYIYFVDSDDCIATNTLEILYNCAEQTGCTSIYYGLKHFYRYNSHGVKNHNIYLKDMGEINVLSGVELLKKLADEEIISFAIGRQFFNRQYLEEYNIEFHEGIIYEDCFFTVKTLINSDKVCYLKKELYEYWHRQESTSKSILNEHNLYSTFCVFKDIDDYWKTSLDQGRFDEEKEKVMCRYYEYFLNNTRNIYTRLPDKERKKCKQKLSLRERIDFELLLELKMEGVKCKTITKANLDYILQYERIIIYGAGVVGTDIYNILKRNGISVWKFAVTKIKGNPQNIDGVLVESLHDIAKKDIDNKKILVIIGVLGNNQKTLVEELKKVGLNNYLCL